MVFEGLVEGDAAETLLKLIDVLEDLDDVQSVYGGYEISEAEMNRIAGVDA